MSNLHFWISNIQALWRSEEVQKCRLDMDSIEHFYKCNCLTSMHFKGLKEFVWLRYDFYERG